jgi:adenosylmethionine-8-amino-7-oxononanoate aminotransferase
MFGGLAHEQALTLARRLAALLPAGLDRVFFSESGSVSVEVAMKMAVQYWINKGVRGRTRFVAFSGGYHGDTTGAMAICDPEGGMHRLFRGLLPEHFILDLPRDEERAAGFERAGEIAGIVVEPLVQGAGGMRFHDAAVLGRLRAIADRFDILLIFDEIFTGFGRAGTMFACEAAGVAPDIVTLSKALTGGLACAAANASLDLFEREPRLEEVRAIEAALARDLEACRALPRVVDVRVRGAIGVVQLDRIDDVDALRRRFIQEGVFVRPFGDVVYLTPAFTIGEDDLAALTRAVVKVVGELNAPVS